VAQGSWHSLQELKIFSNHLELQDMQHLARSTLPQLTHLELDSCSVGPGMCKALVNGQWPHLAVLNIRGNLLKPADLQDLAQGLLPSLASLNLDHNRIGVQSSMTGWDLCNWPHLTELTVSQCSLGVSDIQGLVRCHWPLLAHLNVSYNSLEYTYLRSLAQGHWPELLELRLAYNDNSAAEDLHQADWKSLRMLDLGASHCTPLEAVHAVLQVFRESLQTLNVCCEMHSVTAAVAQQQSWPCKTSLRLDITASAAILQSLAHEHWPIRWLSLQCLHNNTSAIAQLFQISLTRMESLSLCGHVNVGNPACRFQDGNWPALQHLDLACGLQDDFMVQLTNGQWPLLETLDLSSNYLSLQGVAQLVAGHGPNLSLLDLQCNDFDIPFDSVSEEHDSFV
jgi:hypothetical protein